MVIARHTERHPDILTRLAAAMLASARRNSTQTVGNWRLSPPPAFRLVFPVQGVTGIARLYGRRERVWHEGCRMTTFDGALVLGCIMAGLSLSAWSVIAAGAFLLSALLLTVRFIWMRHGGAGSRRRWEFLRRRLLF